MKIKIFVLTIIIITASLVVLARNNQKDFNKDGETISEQSVNQEVSFDCPVDELRLDELPNYAKNNETVKKIMIDNCYWGTTELADTDKDGVGEIMLQTVGYDCASCHAQDIYIIDEDQVTFSYSGEDLGFVLTDKGFSVREPIRKPDEAYCCPSESRVTRYTYTNSNYEVVGVEITKY